MTENKITSSRSSDQVELVPLPLGMWNLSELPSIRHPTKGTKKAQQNLLRFPILDELKKACEPFRFINDFFPDPCFCCFPADCPKTWSHCLFCLEWLFWKPMILGIGLAIAKKIVENHNGLISATGELDKGATFDVYIPIRNS